jgi:hypothetical protein
MLVGHIWSDLTIFMRNEKEKLHGYFVASLEYRASWSLGWRIFIHVQKGEVCEAWRQECGQNRIINGLYKLILLRREIRLVNYDT